jgi:hypothetical protein
MINQFTHSHQLLILNKYKTRISRLRKAILDGSFMRYSADKKRQLFQSLARYERQLRQWGIALSAGTLLLLPPDGLLAQTPLPVGSEFLVNTYTSSSQNYPSVAMGSDGDFVVSWQSPGQDEGGYDIYAQRYNNAGVAQGAEFRVNTYTTSSQYYPSVAMDSDGDFVVSWMSDGQDGNVWGIYAQRYDNAGVAQGAEFRVNTYTTSYQYYPSVAMDNDGDFVVSWMSDGQDGSGFGIYAQRYNNAGVAQGAEFRVNTYTTSNQQLPSVAMDSDGDFVVSWMSDGQDGNVWGIYAQRYDNAGVAQGAEFRVNTYTTSSQYYPSVAMDSDGDFVVSWQSPGQDGGGYDIYAQRYDNAGVAQGAEFRVNTYTTEYQYYPSVAMDSDGDFVVSWMSDGQDGSGFGIYAQRYDNAGVAQGAEFRVNTNTILDQRFPSVAMDSDGDFGVSWISYGQDGSSYGTYAQRYMFPPILPIELLHLTGHEEPTANIIAWTTATEKNSAWLIIERSSNGADTWTEIGRVAGAGNSTTPVSYKISDDNPLPLGYYRLSSEDFDGTVQYSEVISISRATTELSILNIFPVPVEQEASIIVYMPASGEVNVSLHNALGQLVFQNNTVLTKGSNDIKMNWGNIPAGNYAVTIENGISRGVQQVVKM